jgi:hypothetical protein
MMRRVSLSIFSRMEGRSIETSSERGLCLASMGYRHMAHAI